MLVGWVALAVAVSSVPPWDHSGKPVISKEHRP
jgi:hypothetical protein